MRQVRIWTGWARVRAGEVAGFQTYRRGVDLFSDVRRFLPALRVAVIFDVGANVGQSALAYRDRAPDAEIYAFEPVAATVAKLRRNVGRHARIHVVPVGLGARDAIVPMTVDPEHSDRALVSERGQPVALRRLDEFCDQAGIDRVNFVKIDTEGHDLDVLEGAGEMLALEAIDLISVEAGTSPENRLHVPLEELKGFLEGYGYRLFGFYEQVGEWGSERPNLRRVDAVFLSRRTIERNRGGPGWGRRA